MFRRWTCSGSRQHFPRKDSSRARLSLGLNRVQNWSKSVPTGQAFENYGVITLLGMGIDRSKISLYISSRFVKMSRTIQSKPLARSEPRSKIEQKLLTRALKGDRKAYLHLFLAQLPGLDRFIRHEIHYSETIGAVERGLIDPCAIVDQVYIAGLNSLAKIPAKTSSRGWLRYLALHIMRQQVRIEHEEEPAGISIEHALTQDGSVDTDLWEYYQPDDVSNVEDLLVDRSAADPEALLELHETEIEIEQTINRLSPELRELVMLRMVEGLSIDQIAVLKDKPPPEVRQAIQDACEALRKLTSDQAEQ
jgi:DNA-directed RNA polymerase specialized sigma24 family protein